MVSESVRRRRTEAQRHIAPAAAGSGAARGPPRISVPAVRRDANRCDSADTDGVRSNKGIRAVAQVACHFLCEAVRSKGSTGATLVCGLYRLFPVDSRDHGYRDPFMSDCQRLADTPHRSRIEVALRVGAGIRHVFEWCADIPEADQSMDEIA